MSNILEEKLREAACLGDKVADRLALGLQKGNDEIAEILIAHGAYKTLRDYRGETPYDLCGYHHTLEHIGVQQDELGIKYVPNPLSNGQVDVAPRIRPKHTDFSNMPTTSLPAAQNDDLILKVRVNGSTDPDFIEIEIPRWKLTYNNLLKICCEELEVVETQVERVRKLPNTRLRKDSDVKRLKDYHALELVLKSVGGDKTSNCYQSISTCKDQTILY